MSAWNDLSVMMPITPNQTPGVGVHPCLEMVGDFQAIARYEGGAKAVFRRRDSGRDNVGYAGAT